MELVTGRAGTDHISSADMASLYRGVLVADDVVLASGEKLSCTMLNANTAEIGTGDCLLQAHQARVEVAEQLTIESGSNGFNRNDLIVARYTLGTGNIQAVYLAVIKGTPVAGDAEDPDYTEGDIDGGSTLVEFPLWRIPITGVNVGTPERVMPLIDTLQDQITALGETVTPSTANITKASGLTMNYGYVVKVGSFVFLNAWISGISGANNQVKVANIPSGYRPTESLVLPLGTASGDNISRGLFVQIDTGGDIYVKGCGGTAAISGFWTV